MCRHNPSVNESLRIDYAIQLTSSFDQYHKIIQNAIDSNIVTNRLWIISVNINGYEIIIADYTSRQNP